MCVGDGWKEEIFLRKFIRKSVRILRLGFGVAGYLVNNNEGWFIFRRELIKKKVFIVSEWGE